MKDARFTFVKCPSQSSVELNCAQSIFMGFFFTLSSLMITAAKAMRTQLEEKEEKGEEEEEEE